MLNGGPVERLIDGLPAESALTNTLADLSEYVVRRYAIARPSSGFFRHDERKSGE